MITLIAIDTLQKVRGVTTDNAGAYASDYRDLSLLKALADKHQLSILLVHHTSKRPNEQGDPFKRISGTTAIIGAADGCMMLYKRTAYEKNATLAVTGRDVESRLLTVRQTNRFDWVLEEDTAGEELQRAVAPPVIGQVCDLVIRCGGWSGTASELSALLNQDTLIPAQVLTGKINRYNDLLYQQGIRHFLLKQGIEAEFKQDHILFTLPDGKQCTNLKLMNYGDFSKGNLEQYLRYNDYALKQSSRDRNVIKQAFAEIANLFPGNSPQQMERNLYAGKLPKLEGQALMDWIIKKKCSSSLIFEAQPQPVEKRQRGLLETMDTLLDHVSRRKTNVKRPRPLLCSQDEELEI